MTQDVHRHSFFLIPMTQNVGLTSISLGLVHALLRDGIKVGFVKPIAQPQGPGLQADLSTYFARTMCHIDAPESITFVHAEELTRTGETSTLMEEVVNIVEQAQAKYDILIIEGLIPNVESQLINELNAQMIGCLTANVIPVVSGSREPKELAEAVELANRRYTDQGNLPLAGVIVNKAPSGAEGQRLRAALEALKLPAPILGLVPYEPHLNSPRLMDVVSMLGLKVERPGNVSRARVREVLVAARSVENIIDRLKPGTLVVTAGDRSDVILAAALASQRGVQLAGLLLTCGDPMAPSVANLIVSTQQSDLTVLCSDDDTFATATRLAGLTTHVSADDPERMQQLLEYVAENMATQPLRQYAGTQTATRLTPPAFRYRMMQLARAANKRIVLPEGDEPRTLQAAVICHEKKLAHCVLLGNPARIHEVASLQGLTLPDDIEIVDPDKVRARYVPQLVELRKSKGITPQMAEAQLEDTVVMGTVMLTMDEVDGLVSGAVHTTASTVRPALQLIKTAPGEKLVSSVFFMLMPDQVLVYGDCAINPDPTAEELACIAVQSAESAIAFGVSPRVAMISYSTGTSGTGTDVEKVREATRMAKEARPDLIIDGPMQYDAATVMSVGKQKAPDSPVAGRANVFIFPDLNTGNTTYKAVQRSAGVISIGPMLQGLRKPVNDLSRGALVDDIVYTIALTAIQATITKK